MEEGITAEDGGVTASGENEYIDEFDASFPSVSGNNVDSQETVIGVEDKVLEFPEFTGGIVLLYYIVLYCIIVYCNILLFNSYSIVQSWKFQLILNEFRPV